MRRKLEVLTNVLVIAIAAIFILGPSGPVVAALDDWRTSVVERRRLVEMWPRIVDGAPVVGKSRKPVVAVEFLDYQCPFCKRMHHLTREWGVEEEFAIAIRHLPLRRIHANADLAARISICGEDDLEQWNRIHSLLFEVADSLHEMDWVSMFQASGVKDAARIADCINSSTAAERLETDEELAALLELRSTPAYVFQDGIERGTLSEEELRRQLQPRGLPR